MNLANTGMIKSSEYEKMETEELLALYKQTGNVELKGPLVLRYVGLVKSIALQICGVYTSFAELDDIVNEGVIALMSAVDKYDPDMGIKFETYVSKRIRGMIIDLARQQDWLPRSIRKRAREIDKATGELYERLGHFPSDRQIAEFLDITEEQYREDVVNLNLSNILSLETLLERREESCNVQLPAKDDWGQPEQSLQDAEFRKILADGIGKLGKREQMVLSLYYEKELNMREIAQVLEISVPRVSQIHSKAVAKLRIYMEHYLYQDDKEETRN